MKIFLSPLFSSTNRRALDKIFDFNLYEINFDEYRKCKDEIKFITTKDVDYALDLPQELPHKEKYSYYFNPVSDVLRFFNRNQ
jgi:hypothetical protein